MHLSGLFIYPVKSLRGLAVDAAGIDPLGVIGDRRFLVVDESGRFLTQRTLPAMARIAATLCRDLLTLSAEGAGAVNVARAPDPAAELRTVSVWKSEGLQAEDCGAEAAGWLSDFLHTPCRLVRAGGAFQRPMRKPAAGPGDRLAFADGDPLLVVSEASLADLNRRLATHGDKAIPMDRFRPNLVIAGCGAFAEDTWVRFRVGSITFRAGGPCARCVVTTTHQLTGQRGKEPLHTLASYRRDVARPGDVNFGQNLIHETKTGTLRVGEKVELLP